MSEVPRHSAKSLRVRVLLLNPLLEILDELVNVLVASRNLSELFRVLKG